MCVVSAPLFSVPASELHLISKFILKVCHLSCEPLLGCCSEGGRGVQRLVRGEERDREGIGGIIREERSDDLGGGWGCMWDTAAHILFTAFFLFSISLLPSSHLCP